MIDHRDLAKKIIRTWLMDEGEVPDIIDLATNEELDEWADLVGEVTEELKTNEEEEEDDTNEGKT